jgi:hypothetical protein
MQFWTCIHVIVSNINHRNLRFQTYLFNNPLLASPGFDCRFGLLQLHRARRERRSAWWFEVIWYERCRRHESAPTKSASSLYHLWNRNDLTLTVVSLGPLENLNRPTLTTKPRKIFVRDLSCRALLPPILTVTQSLERNFSNLRKLAELAARASWATFWMFRYCLRYLQTRDLHWRIDDS